MSFSFRLEVKKCDEILRRLDAVERIKGDTSARFDALEQRISRIGSKVAYRIVIG